MAKIVFGMNQSLDGYVDHTAFGPSPTLFRHFIEQAQGQAGSVYGRTMYEIMRYWDDDQAEWGADERAYAAAWRNQPKWVVSRSLQSVGFSRLDPCFNILAFDNPVSSYSLCWKKARSNGAADGVIVAACN